MKTIITTLLTTLAISTFACWFTESNFNATYIASVNGKAIHYTPSTTISQAQYINGQEVDLPITVQVKVSDRFEDQGGEIGAKAIKKAKLQYKIVRKNGVTTPFITVKSIDNPTWRMNFSNPVNLFGRGGIINIPEGNISQGDEIIIRIWLTDDTYETGDIESDINISDIPDIQNSSNINCGSSGWIAPHVFRVKFSGKYRLII